MHWNRSEQTIAALVQTCLDAHGQNCQAWEHPIDPLVARAGFPQEGAKD